MSGFAADFLCVCLAILNVEAHTNQATALPVGNQIRASGDAGFRTRMHCQQLQGVLCKRQPCLLSGGSQLFFQFRRQFKC